MQDNEFEKQVRDKLTGLNIEGGEAVWDKVEERLHRKEKRRRWMIWIPVGLTGIILSALIVSQISMHLPESFSQQGQQQSYPKANTQGQQKTDSEEKRQAQQQSNPEGTTQGQQKTDSEEKRQAQQQSNPEGTTQGLQKTDSEEMRQAQQQSNLQGTTQGLQKTDSEEKRQAQQQSNPEGNTQGQQKSNLAEKLKVGRENLAIQETTNALERSDKQVSARLKQSQSTGIFVSPQKKQADEKSPDQQSPGEKKDNRQLQSSRVLLAPHRSLEQIKDVQKKQPTTENKQPAESEKKLITEDRRFQNVKAQNGSPEKIESSSPETNVEISKEIYASTILSSSALPRSVAVIKNNYNSPSIPPKKISKTRKPLTWGIEAGLGRSGITSGKLDNLFYSPAADVSNYQVISVGANLGTIQLPSQVQPGLAAAFGMYISLPLNEQLYFKAGLRYDLFTTSIKVGSKMNQSVRLQSLGSGADKSIESYYRTGRNEQYNNRYNFIDLPVSFGIEFARYSRLPFAWEFGITPGILVGSNALNYNQTSSIYYNDNSVFRKTQMQVFTAIPFQFLNRKTYALEIVPGFNYMSSSLFKPELNEKKHLLSAGISLRAKF